MVYLKLILTKCCPIIALVTGFLWLPCASANSGQKAVEELRQVKMNTHKNLTNLDSKISQVLKSLEKKSKSKTNKQHFQNTERALQSFIDKRKELILRQDFYDRLILNIERNYTAGGSFIHFLQVACLEIASIELKTHQPSSIWRFATYLSEALKKLPERNDSIVSFIVSYVDFSSISQPIRPDEYLSQRDYTNSAEFYSAKKKTPELAGDIIEKRLKAIEKKEAEKVTQENLGPSLPTTNKPFLIELKSDLLEEENINIVAPSDELSATESPAGGDDQLKVKLLPKKKQ